MSQRLRHYWAAVFVTDNVRTWLGGGQTLDLPFQSPVPAGASCEDTAIVLLAPLFLKSESLHLLHTLEVEDGRIIRVFRFAIPGSSLSARAGTGLEPVLLADLSLLAGKNMLGPVIGGLIEARISL